VLGPEAGGLVFDLAFELLIMAVLMIDVQSVGEVAVEGP
jgi:hypothetical protein